MSIRDAIRALDNQELFTLAPRDRSSAIRSLFVSREVYDDVTPPYSETYYGYRLGEFRTTLDTFTRGGRITIARHPFEKKAFSDIAPVDPVALDVWDIRSLSPQPQIRCFGAWAEPDTFVALTWRWRDDIEDFAEEARECRAEWNRLFPHHKPYRGKIDDYITFRRRVG